MKQLDLLKKYGDETFVTDGDKTLVFIVEMDCSKCVHFTINDAFTQIADYLLAEALEFEESDEFKIYKEFMTKEEIDNLGEFNGF